jgi:hypothetical protein
MRLEILLLPCQYIFSLTNFVGNNQEYFKTNSATHYVNARNRNHLHREVANPSYFKKVHTDLGSTYSTVYCLVSKSLVNEKAWFKIALKMYSNIHPFLAVE